MLNLKSLAFITLMLFSPFIFAGEHTVKLLSSGSGGQIMVMEPGFLKISKGDTVKFVPSDSSHNAQSVVIPKSAENFVSPYGKTTSIKFSTEGVYIYKCFPHLSLAMVGVIQVGKPVNLADAKTQAAKIKAGFALNKDRLDGYLAQVK